MRRNLIDRDLEILRERAVGTIAEGHKANCRFLISAVGAAAIECEHGFDACPICDPCTCNTATSEVQDDRSEILCMRQEA